MVRRIARIVLLILISLLLAALGYGSYTLGNFAFKQFMGYSGPALGALPPGRPTTPISRRVVVVVVDGLREDTSHQMPHFQALRERGADMPSWTEVPSLSLPGYTVLGTGAYPEFSGVTTNWYDGAVRVDSLFARAREAGLPTALVTMGSWEQLYGPWTGSVYTASWSASGHDYLAVAGTTEDIGREALDVLAEQSTGLLYVHFGETDEAGHARGGDSQAYLDAARHIDTQIGAIAAALDWGKDTLILTADHGMTGDLHGTGGGHGGDEPEVRRVPLVLRGRGIAPGAYPEGRQADVVPTVAALLGLPIPAHNQGYTRLDALVLPPEQRAQAALALGEQQEALYSAYLRSLGAAGAVDGLEQARAAMAARRYDEVPGQVREFLTALEETVARTAANRTWQERLVRSPYLLVPALAGLACFLLYRPRRDLVGVLFLSASFYALFWLLYFVLHGHTVSFSSITNVTEAAFFQDRTIDALVSMGIVAVAAGVFYRRRPCLEVVWGGTQSALLIAWAMLVQLGLFLWLYGLTMTWRLPPLGFAFFFYLNLLALVGIGLGGLLFPWLALGVARSFDLVDWAVQRIRARRTGK